MATKVQHNELEKNHFKALKPYLQTNTPWCERTLEELLDRGFIQVSTIAEHAVAAVQGCRVVGEDAYDLEYGGDVKLSTVRTSSYGQAYSAPVTNIYGKTGWLYVQVYERKQDRFYWFAIPREAYSHIPKTSNIEIPFEMDGTPKRVNRCSVNWWDYELSTFEEMAVQGLDPGQLPQQPIKLAQAPAKKKTRRAKIKNIFDDLFYVDNTDQDFQDFLAKLQA